MGTTADKLEYLDGTKSAIKQAIVNKGVAVPDGTTFRAYAEKIGSIIKVPALSNPGSAGDLRSGKQLAGADGSVISGALAEVEQATPSISVSSGGLITASATQSGGIVPAGSKSFTKQLTTQAAKTVTPGTTNQTAVASGRYTTGDVVVSGDANLVPENIAEGVSIFGVAGTHSGEQPKYTVTNVETNLFICNVFYPKLASPGQYVVTIKGEYNYRSGVFVDGSDKPIAFTEAERYDDLPPLVKAEVDKQKQENPDALDVPVTRAPPITAPGYLWFVMPAENVTTKNVSY